MSSGKAPEPSRWEAAALVLLMVATTAWYAFPQLVYSLYPLADTWRSFFP
ncbi:MAG TPA: hypothetical protein VJK02_24955 [Anaerolineales bacterium]|nr:hypothetical protein [Anaerolineales bacterium]